MPTERAVVLEWKGDGLVFTGRGTNPESPSVAIDGNSEHAPSPMQVLLLAAASCAGSDVVLILDKMRQDLRALSIAVTAARRDIDPRRYTSIRFEFHAQGDRLDKEKLERAVSLSIEKYCSVLSSLAPDIEIAHATHVA